MDEDIRAVIHELHAAPAMASLAIAGAGSLAVAWLLAIPGASRTVLSASMPYSPGSVVDMIGWQPQQYVSPGTAVSLATAAYAQARRYGPASTPLFGLGCTAAIATDRPKRGEHRAHIAVRDERLLRTFSVVFEKGLRDRPAEEDLTSRLVIHALAAAAGMSTNISSGLSPGEHLDIRTQTVERPVERLLAGEVDSLSMVGPGVFAADERGSAAILSGSFAPLHDGHLRLVHAAARWVGLPPVFEISTCNVDKPPLEPDEITRRLGQFEHTRCRVALSREPLYRDKARLYPGSVFVLGYDTAERTVNPAYYHGDRAEMHAALAAVREAGCRFLVAGRLVDGIFRTLADLSIPPGFDDLFAGLPEEAFRLDISSTELRQRSLE
jgi:hypothetical protein